MSALCVTSSSISVISINPEKFLKSINRENKYADVYKIAIHVTFVSLRWCGKLQTFCIIVSEDISNFAD